uniref:SWIM-type domain-containing protein n=1 Tax=Strigamia maritima TaxID=126957 RepID=T1JIW7_STRMM
MNDRIKSLFDDLGKPTLRGVRKCPKCGTYNGTRGISCKNKQCGAIFKESAEKKKTSNVEAVKIITGSTAQVYSVRVRDRGPDYRGFVQLPLIAGLDTSPEQSVDSSLLTQTSARCFVESCHKANQQQKVACQHIKAASQCFTEAQPLSLKNAMLQALQVTNEIKHAIWLLATEMTGPVVQRVSKHVMVVKCKANPKHPLGFLHFGFFETSRNRDAPEHKFHCSCRAFKSQTNSKSSSKDENQKRCVHFYACICAFSSNDKLAEEFAYYLNMDTLNLGNLVSDQRLVAIFSEMNDDSCKLDLLPEEPTRQENILSPTTKRRRKDDTIAQASSALLTLQDGSTTTHKKIQAKKMPGSIPRKSIVGNVSIDETQVSISFHQWLASVTERINQTMHYQFDGNPEPLVFHAPQLFFDCLQQRISLGSKKKRLPNSTTGFVRKDALPLGTFTKYTWHITNILQVKQIFDTSEMPLEVLRSFVENRDNTYDLYDPPKSEIENNSEVSLFRKTETQPLIKPFELKTFLKVGNTSTDQKEPTPFVIEWIPDILPKMKIGELRIKFEYGHQRNGVVENRLPIANQQIIQIQSL